MKAPQKVRFLLSSARKTLSSRLRLYARHEIGMLVLALGYLLAYWRVFQQFPPFVRNEVIFEVGSVLLGVEGILVALAPQIQTRWMRNFVAVGLGIPAILLSVSTIAIAKFQSVQLQWLSTSETTLLFQTQGFLFGLLVELYALGILFEHEKDSAKTRR